LHWKAALYDVPGPRREGQRGAPRKKGDRLPTPKAMIEDLVAYPAQTQTIAFPQVTRELRIQVIRGVLWYRGCKTEPVMVVLVRDPLGQWRDEALVCTDPTASAEFVLQGYCRRWSVEICRPHYGRNDTLYQPGRSGYRGGSGAAGAGTLVSQAA
jgi:hypothetical protein